MQRDIDRSELSGLVQAIADYIVQHVSQSVAELVAQRAKSGSESMFDQESIPYGVSRRKYLELARKGAFPTMKEGRRVLCRLADFDAWVATRHRVESVASTPTRTLAPVAKVQPGDPSLDDLLAGAKIVASRGGRR